MLVVFVGFWFWQSRSTTEPAKWLVTQVRDDQRTLVVDWPLLFDRCGGRPSVEFDERATEIRIRATYPLARSRRFCGTNLNIYPAVEVHLKQPLAGRRIVGERQASVPVESGVGRARLPIMPSVVGMDAAAARLALSRAQYPEHMLPSADTPGYVTRQWPHPGTNLTLKSSLPTKPPRLTFSS